MVPGTQPTYDEANLRTAFPELSFTRSLTPGGQGAVYLCLHPRYGACVLKVVSPEYVTRTDREIADLRRIQHPGVIGLLDAGLRNLGGNDIRYHLTPFIEGRDLAERIQSNDALDEGQTVTLLLDMCGALDLLWSLGIVHRDIKPANILTTSDGHFILIDLGMARHLNATSLTLPWQVPGTPGYMSPEHAAGERQLTVKSDIFELGITAYEALAGIHPFARNQALIMATPTPPALPEGTDCSAGSAHLLQWMLQARPVDRPQPTAITQALSGLT